MIAQLQQRLGVPVTGTFDAATLEKMRSDPQFLQYLQTHPQLATDPSFTQRLLAETTAPAQRAELLRFIVPPSGPVVGDPRAPAVPAPHVRVAPVPAPMHAR